MYCTQCGGLLPEEARFCPKCGTPVPADPIPEEPQVIPEQTEEPVGNAAVYAENGKTVNLRSRPNTSAQLVDRVPVGTVVQVAETARNDKNERWSRVTANGKTGYMLADYLRGKGFADADEVTITLPRAAAQALLEALQKTLNA